MDELLAIAHDLPRRSVAAGERLLTAGASPEALYVLLDGTLRVEKAGVTVAAVREPGACVGEMSLLLGVTATADVIADEPTEVAVIDDARALLETEPRFPLALARLLAA